MGEIPTTVNQTAVTVDSIIKNAIQNVADPIIENVIIAEFPWLGLPVIKQVFIYFFEFLGNYFYKYTSQATTALIIDIQTKGEASKAATAIENLKNAINSGDTVDISKASKDFDDAMAALVHWDGST